MKDIDLTPSDITWFKVLYLSYGTQPFNYDDAIENFIKFYSKIRNSKSTFTTYGYMSGSWTECKLTPKTIKLLEKN